jgi:MFS transporter, DHA1 family, inner membrane transport protein
MAETTAETAIGRAQRATRLPAFTMMFGNFITGVAILAPAGMLVELATGLSVTIRDAGLLLTFGAIVLCVGSPLMAWITTAIDRRTLLAATLGIIALGHIAAAFAPDYTALLVLRTVTLAFAAIYTPQAASTIALIVPEQERPRAISFVFLGWSLSLAIGLPLVTFIADSAGWRAAFGAIGAAAAVAAALHVSIPAGLRGAPLSLRSWGQIASNRHMLLLLAVTAAWVSGQFMILGYIGPLTKTLGGATPLHIAIMFAMFGVMGFIGNVVATRVVTRIGAFATSVCSLSSLVVGATTFSLSAGTLAVMGTGFAFMGLGFAALNSMQQARLVAAGPHLASATVALNTSLLYVGQAGLELHAAGAAGGRRAASRQRDGCPQHVASLRRAGHRFRDWRRDDFARSPRARRFRRRRLPTFGARTAYSVTVAANSSLTPRSMAAVHPAWSRATEKSPPPQTSFYCTFSPGAVGG